MTQSTDTPDTLFLAKLTLPVRLIMARTAVECAARVAEILSFDTKDAYALKLAVDESFCNAVQHFSGPANSSELIHVEFFVEGDSLVVSIRERGIPFDFSQAERYTPDSLKDMNKPGLGMLLMHSGMDSVELFVHGREGKETRMTKSLAYGALPPELMDTKPVRRGKKRVTVKEPEVRLAEVTELPEVCRLAWRCYGFTQEEFLYDKDALIKKVENGEFTPVIAIDPDSGNMIGHIGFKYHDPAVKVPELGLAFVDPAYRSPGLPKTMAQVLFDLAEAEGDKGIFDCSVTTHTFSQQAMHEMGSRPCSLLMGIAADGMQAKELATSRQEKGSTINHYYAFDRTPRTLYVSPRHHDMVAEIYDWLELPRTLEAGSVDPATGESSVSVFPLPDELNVAFVIVHTIGESTAQDVADGLHQCKRDRRDAVYAFLPMGVAESPQLMEQCERMGFSFAGVMPHIHDGDDRLLMQYIDIPLNLDAIRMYGDMSRKLFDYIKDEQKRVLKTG